MNKKSIRACIECGRVKQIQARGLCARCYDKPQIKAKYPAKPYLPYANLTDADVERQVAERMASMPPTCKDLDMIKQKKLPSMRAMKRNQR